MASHDAYYLLIEEEDPTTFLEAMHNPNASMWMIVMQEELRHYIEIILGNLLHFQLV